MFRYIQVHVCTIQIILNLDVKKKFFPIHKSSPSSTQYIHYIVHVRSWLYDRLTINGPIKLKMGRGNGSFTGKNIRTGVEKRALVSSNHWTSVEKGTLISSYLRTSIENKILVLPHLRTCIKKTGLWFPQI
jgi:hypothetical protein